MDEPQGAERRFSARTKWATVAGGVLAVVAVVAAVVASGGQDDKPVAVARTSTTSTTATAEPKPSGPAWPLTGLALADPASADRPALVVKIDNLDIAGESAVPQSGLAKADVVVEEIVEGDITRLVAVFHSQNPGRVGPVRSARTTDVHLLPQFGRVLLAWSGGNGGVVAAVHGSSSIIDVGHDAASGSYARDRSRKAPHNLYVEANELWGRSGDAPAPRQMFFYRTAGQPVVASAQPSKGVDLTWGGGRFSSPVSWRWNAKRQLFERSQNGRPHLDADGSQLVAKNVVVLVTRYGRSPADTRSPEAVTTGSGDAFAFTNGRMIRARWDRPSEDRPASLVDRTGAPIFLTPGQTWIELPRVAGTTLR